MSLDIEIRQVEHEAYLSLLAARAGVRTPEALATVTTTDGSVLLALPMVAGARWTVSTPSPSPIQFSRSCGSS